MSQRIQDGRIGNDRLGGARVRSDCIQYLFDRGEARQGRDRGRHRQSSAEEVTERRRLWCVLGEGEVVAGDVC